MKYPFLFESLRLSKKDDNYWILWITFKTQNDPWFLSLNQKKKNRLSGVRYTKIDFLFLFYRILSILIYTRREGQCLKEIDNGLYYVFYWYLLLLLLIVFEWYLFPSHCDWSKLLFLSKAPSYLFKLKK